MHYRLIFKRISGCSKQIGCKAKDNVVVKPSISENYITNILTKHKWVYSSILNQNWVLRHFKLIYELISNFSKTLGCKTENNWCRSFLTLKSIQTSTRLSKPFEFKRKLTTQMF